MPGSARARHTAAAAGPLTAAVSVSGIAGAAADGGRRWHRAPTWRLLVLLGALTVTLALSTLVSSVVLLGVLLLVAAGPPNRILTTISLLVDQHVAGGSSGNPVTISTLARDPCLVLQYEDNSRGEVDFDQQGRWCTQRGGKPRPATRGASVNRCRYARPGWAASGPRAPLRSWPGWLQRRGPRWAMRGPRGYGSRQRSTQPRLADADWKVFVRRRSLRGPRATPRCIDLPL